MTVMVYASSVMLLDFAISALLMESVSYAHKVIDWTVLKTSA